MSEILVLDFMGAAEAAKALVEEVVGLDHAEVLPPTALLGDVLRRKQLPRPSHLIVVGAPPTDAIGFSAVPLLAVALRPRTVTLLDARSRGASSMSLGRFLASSAPIATGQLLGSTVAVAAQHVLARP